MPTINKARIETVNTIWRIKFDRLNYPAIAAKYKPEDNGDCQQDC